MDIPKIFISYSHDNDEHKEWVLELAKKLISDGIDVLLDQWDLDVGADIPHFMETSISQSDYVLMICSSVYVKKANEGRGGVGYEKMILTSEYLKDINEGKVIPVIRNNPHYKVPSFLQTKYYLDFNINSDLDYSYDELVRKIHNSPKLIKPEIGKKPAFDKNAKLDLKKDSGLKTVMSTICDVYNQVPSDYVNRKNLIKASPFHRIKLELLLSEAQDKGYIEWSRDVINITEKGKLFAINNELV